MSRYEITGNIEADYEDGSSGILKNNLNISSKEKIDELEYILLRKMEAWVTENTTQDQQLTEKGIKTLHKVWLSPLYSWAGNYRTVEMSKGDFAFASSRFIPNLMEEFESKFLKEYSPCAGYSLNELVEALARVHVEFILIHPFREGNGRLSRVLSNIMVFQAGYPSLDYSLLTDKNKYIIAIQAGVSQNYSLMEDLFREMLERSIEN